MVTYAIPDISCAHCVRAVTEAVKALDPAAAIDVDLGSKTARIACGADAASVQAKLRDAGYTSSVVGG